MPSTHAFQRETTPEQVIPLAPTRTVSGTSSGRPLPRADHHSSRAEGKREAGRQDWASALLALETAAQNHQTRMEQIHEFETRIMDRMKQLEEALREEEGRARAAERRAHEAERRAAEAEEWMKQMCEKIHEHFGSV